MYITGTVGGLKLYKSKKIINRTYSFSFVEPTNLTPKFGDRGQGLYSTQHNNFPSVPAYNNVQIISAINAQNVLLYYIIPGMGWDRDEVKLVVIFAPAASVDDQDEML